MAQTCCGRHPAAPRSPLRLRLLHHHVQRSARVQPQRQPGQRQSPDASDLLHDACACHALADRAALRLLPAQRAGQTTPPPQLAGAAPLADLADVPVPCHLDRLSVHAARCRGDHAAGWRLLRLLQSHPVAPGSLLAHLGVPQWAGRCDQHAPKQLHLAARLEALLLPLHLASARRDPEHGSHAHQPALFQLRCDPALLVGLWHHAAGRHVHVSVRRDAVCAPRDAAALVAPSTAKVACSSGSGRGHAHRQPECDCDAFERLAAEFGRSLAAEKIFTINQGC